jgi:hypothetical protein
VTRRSLSIGISAKVRQDRHIPCHFSRASCQRVGIEPC